MLRLKGLGNAVSPAHGEVFGHVLMQIHNRLNGASR